MLYFVICLQSLGYGDLSCIEKVHKTSLNIFCMSRKVPHTIILLYGDLRRFPLSILIKKRVIGFGYKFITRIHCLSHFIKLFSMILMLTTAHILG